MKGEEGALPKYPAEGTVRLERGVSKRLLERILASRRGGETPTRQPASRRLYELLQQLL